MNLTFGSHEIGERYGPLLRFLRRRANVQRGLGAAASQEAQPQFDVRSATHNNNPIKEHSRV